MNHIHRPIPQVTEVSVTSPLPSRRGKKVSILLAHPWYDHADACHYFTGMYDGEMWPTYIPADDLDRLAWRATEALEGWEVYAFRTDGEVDSLPLLRPIGESPSNNRLTA